MTKITVCIKFEANDTEEKFVAVLLDHRSVVPAGAFMFRTLKEAKAKIESESPMKFTWEEWDEGKFVYGTEDEPFGVVYGCAECGANTTQKTNPKGFGTNTTLT